MQTVLSAIMLIAIGFGIVGTFFPTHTLQKIALGLFMMGGILLIRQVGKITRDLGKMEVWWNYFFLVVFCVMIFILGWMWRLTEGKDPFLFLLLLGFLIGKICMLATYQPFQWFHLLLYGLFIQFCWEIGKAFGWLSPPLIQMFVS